MLVEGRDLLRAMFNRREERQHLPELLSFWKDFHLIWFLLK